ncbi:hypothetical protein CROQUDRAFT_93944 [Cronartium quercuum f. sp. fusiforme G11]|uniref:Uncharacterized protein n=1 Tax=Cronartium quercuum f. sp. fusiforme G11 TaxID=708437 RepID=A0A9P6NJJ0_9BASI|nr:hypothetical protein CROQUDRAFT_93944 [Cronartium quercuum f. sp. fusiforme G11]
MGARTIHRHHSDTKLAPIRSVQNCSAERGESLKPFRARAENLTARSIQPFSGPSHAPSAFQRAGVLSAFQPAGPGLEIGREVLPASSLRREERCPLCLSLIVTHILARVPPANFFFRASHRAKAFGGTGLTNLPPITLVCPMGLRVKWETSRYAESEIHGLTKCQPPMVAQLITRYGPIRNKTPLPKNKRGQVLVTLTGKSYSRKERTTKTRRIHFIKTAHDFLGDF